jgi:hypothetical protein
MKGENLSEELKERMAYSYKDLAAITPYTARFWRREVALGRIPCVKSDQAVTILRSDLDQWFAERRRVKGETRNQESLQATT